MPRLTPYLRDEDFIRDKIPMTKEEVRHISVCKLGLTEDAVVYDVGAGTGSIAVEIANLSTEIQVFAIETAPEAVSLIRKNVEKFGLFNVEVVEAIAPEGLEALPVPSHAFIGGSKGNLKAILDTLYAKNPQMRIVMNAVSLEAIVQMQQALSFFQVKDLDITQMSVSKAKELGDYHLMMANNPVYIYAFTFDGGK